MAAQSKKTASWSMAVLCRAWSCSTKSSSRRLHACISGYYARLKHAPKVSDVCLSGLCDTWAFLQKYISLCAWSSEIGTSSCVWVQSRETPNIWSSKPTCQKCQTRGPWFLCLLYDAAHIPSNLSSLSGIKHTLPPRSPSSFYYIDSGFFLKLRRVSFMKPQSSNQHEHVWCLGT